MIIIERDEVQCDKVNYVSCRIQEYNCFFSSHISLHKVGCYAT